MILNNISAEKIFLQLLVDNFDYLDKVTIDFFTTPETREVFTAINKIYLNNQKIDEALLQEYNVTAKWLFEKKTGDIAIYYQILHSQYIKRELYAYSLKLRTEIGKKTADQLVTDNQGLLLKLTSTNAVIVKDPVITAIESSRESFFTRKSKGLSGISLINTELNEMTGGLRKKQLSILAGRPSVGKTLYADNILENHTYVDGIDAQMISLEMPAEIVGQRIISSKLGINFHNFNMGFLSKEDLGKIYEPICCVDCGAKKIISKIDYDNYSVNGTCSECGQGNIKYKIDELKEQSKMIIDDRASLSITQILMSIKACKIQNPNMDLVLIDHLGEIGWAPGEKKTEKIGNICKMLRKCARDLDIHIMLISQLNRLSEIEERPPAMHDLRDSGEIEQTADMILLLHRDKENSPDVLHINLAKQRNGPTGHINAKLDIKMQKMFKDSIVV